MRKLVAVAVKAHRVDPRLHRVLAEQIPRVGKIEKLETFSRENYTLFRTYLESHRDELRVNDLALASFGCVTTIEALTHNAVLRYSKLLSDEAMEALIDEGASCGRISDGPAHYSGAIALIVCASEINAVSAMANQTERISALIITFDVNNVKRYYCICGDQNIQMPRYGDFIRVAACWSIFKYRASGTP